MVKTRLPEQRAKQGTILGQETKIPHATWCGQKQENEAKIEI